MTSCRFISLVLGAVLVLGTAGPTDAAPPGTIYITDHKIEADAASLEKEYKAAAKTTLQKSGDSWHVYFVAFLRQSPGADEINIVFYDTARKEHEPVNAYPFHTKASARIVTSDVEIKQDDGFKAGGKYQVLIARLIGGREQVYARTTLELGK